MHWCLTMIDTQTPETGDEFFNRFEGVCVENYKGAVSIVEM